MKVATLRDVLVDELQDLYDAEKQLVRALPKMARSASDPELEKLFREHLEMTKGQVERLERVFGTLDQQPKSKPCAGMKGLISEQQEIASENRPAPMLDAGLLGAARKVEHYEMAGYTNSVALAQQIGERDAARLLSETLKEETQTDRRLAQVGKRLAKEASRMQVEEIEQPSRGRKRAAKKTTRAVGKKTARAATKKAPRAVGRKTARATGRKTTRAAGRKTTRAVAKKKAVGATGRKSAGARKAAAAGASRGTQARAAGGRGASARPLIDHDEIRRWAEERNAQPACVRGTGRAPGDVGMIRLDFPGFSGRESLEPISWEEWFRAFEENNLALMVQEQTARGQKSNFNKIVSRESIETGARPRVKRAGGG